MKNGVTSDLYQIVRFSSFDRPGDALIHGFWVVLVIRVVNPETRVLEVFDVKITDKTAKTPTLCVRNV